MNTQYILKQYFNKKRSLGDIAKELNTYPNKIRRIILKTGKKLRDKSEAQSQALKSGRKKHPTKGKKRSQTTKDKISLGVSETWRNYSDEELEQRKEQARENWNKLSDEEKTNFLRKAQQAVKKTATEGSKLEKFLFFQLREHGHDVRFHQEKTLRGTKFQIDLFIPNLNLAIEIDGKAHFEQIWDKETLVRRQKNDLKKQKLILGSEMNFIRVKFPYDFVSQRLQNDVWRAVEDIINNKQYLNNKYIEIEV